MEYLKRKNLSKHKEFKRGGSKKAKKVICFKYKRPGYIHNECPKHKHKNKGANKRKKAFKATWDNSSESEIEEEQQKATNLCFMAQEDDNEVPSTSHSSCDDYNDYDDCDDDDRSMMRKLNLKCKNLLSKKKFYKLELLKMSNSLMI